MLRYVAKSREDVEGERQQDRAISAELYQQELSQRVITEGTSYLTKGKSETLVRFQKIL